MFDDVECDGFRIDYGDVKVEDLFFGGISGGQLIKDYKLIPDLYAYLPINGSVYRKDSFSLSRILSEMTPRMLLFFC